MVFSFQKQHFRSDFFKNELQEDFSVKWIFKNLMVASSQKFNKKHLTCHQSFKGMNKNSFLQLFAYYIRYVQNEGVDAS